MQGTGNREMMQIICRWKCDRCLLVVETEADMRQVYPTGEMPEKWDNLGGGRHLCDKCGDALDHFIKSAK